MEYGASETQSALVTSASAYVGGHWCCKIPPTNRQVERKQVCSQVHTCHTHKPVRNCRTHQPVHTCHLHQTVHTCHLHQHVMPYGLFSRMHFTLLWLSCRIRYSPPLALPPCCRIRYSPPLALPPHPSPSLPAAGLNTPTSCLPSPAARVDTPHPSPSLSSGFPNWYRPSALPLNYPI